VEEATTEAAESEESSSSESDSESGSESDSKSKSESESSDGDGDGDGDSGTGLYSTTKKNNQIIIQKTGLCHQWKKIAVFFCPWVKTLKKNGRHNEIVYCIMVWQVISIF